MAGAVTLSAENQTDRHFLPQPGGLIGKNAGPSDRWIEESARSQGIVAYHFSWQPEARSPREQAVFRILFNLLLCGLGTLTVRGRGYDQALKSFNVPPRADEFRRQPVQQLGMAWGFPLRSEVLGRFHQAEPK